MTSQRLSLHATRSILHRLPPPHISTCLFLFFKKRRHLLFVSLPLFLTLCLIRQYLIFRVLSPSDAGKMSTGRKEMERGEREVAEGRGQRGRKMEERRGWCVDGETEESREEKRINSSGALVPHYPGRALSPWQCGRKRIAQAWWASTRTQKKTVIRTYVFACRQFQRDSLDKFELSCGCAHDNMPSHTSP